MKNICIRYMRLDMRGKDLSPLFSNRKLSSILACVARAAKRYVSYYVSQAFRLLSPLRNRKSRGKGKRRRRRRHSGRSNEIRYRSFERKRERKREMHENVVCKRWRIAALTHFHPLPLPLLASSLFFLFAPNRRALNSAFARSSRNYLLDVLPSSTNIRASALRVIVNIAIMKKYANRVTQFINIAITFAQISANSRD